MSAILSGKDPRLYLPVCYMTSNDGIVPNRALVEQAMDSNDLVPGPCLDAPPSLGGREGTTDRPRLGRRGSVGGGSSPCRPQSTPDRGRSPRTLRT